MVERVDVGGSSIAVRRRGQGPAALLIHGTAPATWGELPEQLALSHSVIDYDRRGFGDSPGPPPRELRGHSDDAAGLLEHFDAGAAVIVGWSIGAVIAVELACRHPAQVSGLLLLEPPFRAKRHPRAAMLRAIVTAIVLGRLGRPDAGAERFLRWALSRRDGTDDFDRIDPDDLRRSSAAIVAELAAGTGEHLDHRGIRALAVPTTILAGTDSDPIFTAASQRLAALIPGSRLEAAPHCGHAVQLDAPATVADEIRRLVTDAAAAPLPS